MEATLADSLNDMSLQAHAYPISAQELIKTYHLMLLSRRFDERCTQLLREGKLVPNYHSGVGQEA